MTELIAQAEFLPLWAVFLVTAGGFLSIYVGLGFTTQWLTRRVFPSLGIGRPLGTGRLLPGQPRHEVLGSLLSIAIFGGYGVLTVWMSRMGWVRIIWEPRWALLPLELLWLTLFNDLHFYACHRLLHTPWLYKRVHRAHHLSVTPTPWATYSFHWVESTLLGSVMICSMVFFDLGAMAVLLFPLVSLTLNNLGHMNYDLVPGRSTWHPLAASRRHALHHSRVGGNFGFMLPVVDWALGTAFPPELEERLAEKAPVPSQGSRAA